MIRITRAEASMSSISWVVRITVSPCSRLSRLTSSRTASLATASSPIGLIQEEYLRAVEQGSGQIAAHTLSQAELPDRRVQQARQVHDVNQFSARAAVLIGRHPVDLTQEVKGICDREVPPELCALAKDHADLRHMGDALPPGHAAEDGDAPARRHQDTGEDLDGG